MMTAQTPETEIRCAGYSKSRARDCLAYGRYECQAPACRRRSCGLHVTRGRGEIVCPHCGGPVRANKD